MVDEFIELFTGYQGDFGIADMSSAQLDTEKNKLKPISQKCAYFSFSDFITQFKNSIDPTTKFLEDF